VLDPRVEAFRAALFAAAADATTYPDCQCTRRIAGVGMRLSVVDAGLVQRLLPAFEHLPHTDCPPDFELLVWTTAATGIEPPAFPWSRGHLGPHGTIYGLDGAVRGCAAEDASSLMVWDAARRVASCWWRDAGALKRWDPAAPLRLALHFALRTPERMLVHAAVVGSGDRGVMLAGPGGSGKSTTTKACLAAGLRAAGEDYVVLDASGDRLRAHTVYRTIKTDDRLGARVADPANDPRVISLIGVDVPGAMAQSLEVTAVLVPRVTDARESSLRRVPSGAALRAVAPSTLMQVPPEVVADLRPMSDLVTRAPTFELSLGRDCGVPAIVGQLRAELACPAS
jgi:hypothetical protein